MSYKSYVFSFSGIGIYVPANLFPFLSYSSIPFIGFPEFLLFIKGFSFNSFLPLFFNAPNLFNSFGLSFGLILNLFFNLPGIIPGSSCFFWFIQSKCFFFNFPGSFSLSSSSLLLGKGPNLSSFNLPGSGLLLNALSLIAFFNPVLYLKLSMSIFAIFSSIAFTFCPTLLSL